VLDCWCVFAAGLLLFVAAAGLLRSWCCVEEDEEVILLLLPWMLMPVSLVLLFVHRDSIRA
jgi:hypothetical protein